MADIRASLAAEDAYFRAHEDDDTSVTCHEPDHIEGCVGRAGGDHEFVTRRLNAMRCSDCGHRLDDMGGCDGCAADREAEGVA